MKDENHVVKLDDLPFWVTRKVFLRWSGLSPRALSALVEQGLVKRFVPPHGQGRKCRKGLYWRVDLERLASGELAGENQQRSEP